MNNNKNLEYNIKIEKSKDGNDVLIINDKYIHSRFYPKQEAIDYICPENSLIAIFGVGFAYHVNNIIKNNPKSFFIIYEPCQEVYSIIYNYIDKELLSVNKHNICIFNNLNDNRIFNFIEQLSNLFSEIKLITYSNLGYKTLFPDIELEFYETTKKNIQIIIQNILTESNFIPVWTKNFLYNIKKLTKHALLTPNTVNKNDNLAVIACAGPTLLNDIEYIKTYRDRITLFAVDTAIKPLIQLNINPDFIVSLDGQYYSFDDFPNHLSDESLLVLDIISYPKISDQHNNICYTITENIFKNSMIDYFFKENYIYKTLISTGGTISDYTMNLAINLGFKNIYFTGLDLSYPYLQSHCKGSPFYNYFMNSSSYFATIESHYCKIISNRNVKYANSKDNGDIFTDFTLQNYANHLEVFAKINDKINIYYSSHNALKIQNLKEISLDTLLKGIKTKRFFYRELININSALLSADRIKDFYNNLMNSIYETAVLIKTELENTDFNINNKEKLTKIKNMINSIINNFPFFNKFIIMTVIILQKKNITKNEIIWYKHIGYKLLQSCYFIIRILQKSLKQI